MNEPGLAEKAILTGGTMLATTSWIADVNQILLLFMNLCVAGGFAVSIYKATKRGDAPPQPPTLPRIPKE